MKEHIEALARKEITFDEFHRSTCSDWTRLATTIYMRWRKKLPVGVSLDDVRQEMLLHAWRAVQSYEPNRGPSLKRYVVFNACAQTTRYIHKQRCALRRGDSSPSRHPIAFSEMSEVPDSFFEGLGGDDGWEDYEAIVDARYNFQRAIENAEGIDLFSLVALRRAGGDLCRAGELLFEEFPLRLMQRWKNPVAASEQIERTLCTAL